MSSHLSRAVAALIAGLAIAGASQAAAVGYSFDLTTNYSATLPAGTFTDMGGPSPDTGWWTVTNSGSTTFVGTIGQKAISNADYSYSHAVTLAPGATVSFAVNSESSNQGQYNVADGPDGIELYLTGLMDGVEAVDLHVHDGDIHSGAPRTNPFGVTLDNFVLAGGDPFGRDTGDGFEESQAAGQFSFVERVGVVPEPSVPALLGLAMLGLALRRRSAG